MLATGTYEHILVGGHSLGGVIALLYAARDARINAVVNIMGSTTFPRKYDAATVDAWKTSGSYTTTRDIPNTSEHRTFVIPYAFVIDRLQYHVLEDIGAVHASLLLVASECDQMVPSEELATIYEHANQPKLLITIPGIGHDYRHHPDEVALVNEQILAGLAQLLHE
jgi:alpha-beta hydrolase superfamily lysophospholipase